VICVALVAMISVVTYVFLDRRKNDKGSIVNLLGVPQHYSPLKMSTEVASSHPIEDPRSPRKLDVVAAGLELRPSWSMDLRLRQPTLTASVDGSCNAPPLFDYTSKPSSLRTVNYSEDSSRTVLRSASQKTLVVEPPISELFSSFDQSAPRSSPFVEIQLPELSPESDPHRSLRSASHGSNLSIALSRRISPDMSMPPLPSSWLMWVLGIDVFSVLSWQLFSLLFFFPLWRAVYVTFACHEHIIFLSFWLLSSSNDEHIIFLSFWLLSSSRRSLVWSRFFYFVCLSIILAVFLFLLGLFPISFLCASVVDLLIVYFVVIRLSEFRQLFLCKFSSFAGYFCTEQISFNCWRGARSFL